jgi:hypothetical protein
MGALLSQAVSGEALLRAWEQVRANADHDHDREPGPAVLAFERRALHGLSNLAETLADQTYQPQPMGSPSQNRQAAPATWPSVRSKTESSNGLYSPCSTPSLTRCCRPGASRTGGAWGSKTPSWR